MLKFKPKDNLLNQSNHFSVNIYYTYTSYAFNIQLKTRVFAFLVINKPERRQKKNQQHKKMYLKFILITHIYPSKMK